MNAHPFAEEGALVIVRPYWWQGDRTEAVARVIRADGRRFALRRWLPGCRRWKASRLFPAFAILRPARDADLIGVELGRAAKQPDQLALEVA